MQRRSTAHIASLALASLMSVAHAQFDWAALTNQAVQQTGDGTFYGAGQDSQGTCSFSANFANTNDLPWSTGTALTLALNDAQFADSAGCGLCVMYRGTGAGLGTTPVPSTYTMGFVNNRCPECSKGDLDQATSGDGRWKIEWYAVPCNVGSSSLVYSVVVSSYYWFSLVVSNTRMPITGVAVQIGGSWLALQRTNNNQWAYYNTNGPWQTSFPMGIRVTNVLGETVTDSITSTSGNSGTVQFSATGTGSTSATPVANSTATAAVATPPAAAVATPPAAAAVATPPAAAIAPPPQAAATSPPAPVAVPSQAPPSLLPSGSFYVGDYGQCGGTGSNCNDAPYTSAPCTDAAWPSAVCSSPNFACGSMMAGTWTCLPDNTITFPPPAVHTAFPPAGAPPATPTPPPVAAATPPAAGLSTTTQQDSTQSLAAASPPAVAVQPPPATVTQPPPAVAVQPPPATNTQPPPAPSAQPPPSTASYGQTSPPPTTATASSFSIVSGGQCGGTSQCTPLGEATDKVTCNNGPWSGAQCSDGLTCQANPGPMIWSCVTSPVATGGRRLLSR